MRILLALGTGSRRGDIESRGVSDIDSENGHVATRSKKTGKSMGLRPVPVPVMGELKKYVPRTRPLTRETIKPSFQATQMGQDMPEVQIG